MSLSTVVVPDSPTKQRSNESFHSAGSGKSGRFVTAASVASTGSTRSPSEPRTITSDPSDTASSRGELSEDISFDPRNTNLDYFHKDAGFDQKISQGSFTKVKGLSDCCRNDGKVELHLWRHPPCQYDSDDGLAVVVKRVYASRVGANIGKESNERLVYRGYCARHAEDCLNEIGVYSYLARQNDLPLYILKMHTAFQAPTDVWLVLEHANDGDLFAVAQKLKREGANLSASQLTTWMWQLMQAVKYLHTHGIGHRDISMENVLLCNGVVRLMDFGQAVRTHSSSGAVLRYFNALGKPYYRPPECYVPMLHKVDVQVPADGQPGEIAFVKTCSPDSLCEVLLPPTAVPGNVVAAEPWGYAVTPVDIFACGVCMFILAAGGMPPWREANLRDQHFAWVNQCGIVKLLKAWKMSLSDEANQLLSGMVQSDPTKRPSAEQTLSHSWFSALSSEPLQVHGPSTFVSTTTFSGASFSTPEDDLSTMASSELPCVEFPSSPSDPYRMEAVCRSADSAPMESTASAFGGDCVLVGDFYSMPEDSVVRSATPEELILQRFSAADIAPSAPPSALFALEPTSFFVSDKKASDVANGIVDFLSLGSGAVVQKISSQKFTIKAEVQGDDGVCTMKVRIYDQGSDKLAVEFQRRSGDSAALHSVFDKVATEFSAPKEQASKKDSSDIISKNHHSPLHQSNPLTKRIAQRSLLASLPSMPAKDSSARRRPAGSSMRRSSSTPAIGETASATGILKVEHADTLASTSSRRSTPAGSGLNAIRWRSKLSEHSLDLQRSAPAKFSATF